MNIRQEPSHKPKLFPPSPLLGECWRQESQLTTFPVLHQLLNGYTHALAKGPLLAVSMAACLLAFKAFKRTPTDLFCDGGFDGAHLKDTLKCTCENLSAQSEGTGGEHSGFQVGPEGRGGGGCG